MTQQDVIDALQARLTTMPGIEAVGVSFEGIEFWPNLPTPYVSARLSSYVRTIIGAGPDGAAQIDGTFTVVAYCSADDGRAPAGHLAAKIRSFFDRSTVIQAGGRPLIILSSTEQPMMDSGDWNGIPVVVTFTASDP